ncbi:MAG TPA: alpha/beta hydrolase [Bryobacteraceae bacterium]|nr:alpha/beta hydrolase [Bryobacteraceae bacterium]
MKKLAYSSILLAAAAFAQTVEPLWPNGAPGAVGTEDRDKPTLTLRPADPAKANGTAVIVCPGGGYGGLAMDHEGKQIADWLNGHGISAFILKYRLGPRYRHPAPLQDAQRAIRMVRSRAKELRIEPNRIGIWGFSAGGHLASTTGTHFDDGKPEAAEAIDRASSRPDFMILAYPVISFVTDYVHVGSRRNLLGEPFEPAQAELLSNETQVTSRTPPTFLFHTDADTGVPPENSVLFYMALRKAKVPAEMHIYQNGRHGVGLAPTDPVLSSWAGRLQDWLKVRGLL